MINGEIEKVFDYKIGTKWRWFFPQDLLWFITTKHKIGSLLDFCRFIDKDLHYADFSLSDIGPSHGLILQSLKYFFNKEQRNFMFKRGW